MGKEKDKKTPLQLLEGALNQKIKRHMSAGELPAQSFASFSDVVTAWLLMQVLVELKRLR